MPKEMAEILRKAIADSGLSALALAAKTGVPQPRISAFLSGKGIQLSTAEKLARYLQLELRKK